jgi:hypothetical protein
MIFSNNLLLSSSPCDFQKMGDSRTQDTRCSRVQPPSLYSSGGR